MIAVLIMALAQAGPSSALAREETRERNSLALPSEIAPAIVPYLVCTMAATNTRSPISTGSKFRIAQQRAIASCSQGRAKAKAAALEMLSRSEIAADDREAFVEKALASIEHAQDGVATQLDESNANRTPQE